MQQGKQKGKLHQTSLPTSMLPPTYHITIFLLECKNKCYWRLKIQLLFWGYIEHTLNLIRPRRLNHPTTYDERRLSPTHTHTETQTPTHTHPSLQTQDASAQRVCQARTIIRSSVVLGKKSADCTEVWTNNRSIVLVARCRERNRILGNLNSTFINTIRRHGRRKTDNKSPKPNYSECGLRHGMTFCFRGEQTK